MPRIPKGVEAEVLRRDVRIRERLFSKLDCSGDCWEWTAKFRSPGGYGMLSASTLYKIIQGIIWKESA